MEHETKGTLVILRGTSSTGKSSICKALAEHYNWQYIREDDLFFDCQMAYWKELFPREYALIESAIAHENIYHAVNRHLVIFKSSTIQDEKNTALEALSTIRAYLNNNYEAARRDYKNRFQTLLVKNTTTYRMQGHPIVVESWGMIDSLIDALKETFTIYPILTYVPFHVLFDRTIQRNEHGIKSENLRDHRIFEHTFRGLLLKFSLSANPEKAIGVVEQKDIDAFDKVEEYLSNLALPYDETLPFSRRELSVPEFLKIKQTVIDQVAEGKIYFTPLFDYELLLQTTIKTPKEYADEIVAFVESQAVCEDMQGTDTAPRH